MQVQTENFALAANVINQTRDIYIFVTKNASEDQVAAGIFLRENLSSLEKAVKLICPDPLPVSLNSFAAGVSKTAPVKKLIVSFDWRQNQVDKVSYNLDGENFNFVVTPRDKKIDPEAVKISYQGQDPSLIITIGVHDPSQISGLDKDLLETLPAINIDRSGENSNWASLNFVHETADSVSAVVAQLFEKSEMNVQADTVSILMIGIKSATSNFNEVSDPTTFEAAAFCTRVSESNLQKNQASVVEDKAEQPAPEDWTAPKIFRTKQMPN